MIIFMEWLRRLFKNENFLPLLIIFSFAILAARTLIFEKGYFNMHDDLQMMRQLEMEKCFQDFQIPCRWVPDMGYGYGFPLFNFYPPLPYLVGEIFRIVRFSFVDTAKLTFALSFTLSGFAMYFLAKDFFGKWGGVVSSIFYTWAPYHSVDIYVRGAMNEAWGFVWFPLIFWTSYRLIKEKKLVSGWVVGLALSWTGLMLSHNLMLMIFTPVFAIWCLIFWLKDVNFKKLALLFSSGIFALCLAGFFTLPAILEQKFIHVDTLTQGYYEYIAHFATIGQLLFSRFWGYGPSIWGPNDGMPFQIGQIHWIFSLIVVFAVTTHLLKKNKIERHRLFAIIYVFVFSWVAAFMTHQNSTFLWQKIHFLAFVQFPWRFLAVATFGFSFLAGSIFIIFPRKSAMIVSSSLVLLLVFLNWNYFVPQGVNLGPLTDSQKFSGTAWNLQRTAGIFDYLPNTAKFNPKDPPNGLAEIVDGNGEVLNANQGSNWVKFEVQLPKDSIVRVNIFEFPNWKVTMDNKNVIEFVPETEKYGRMYLNIPGGSHSIYLKLQDTFIRKFGNILSLLSWISLFCYLVWKRKSIYEKVD